MNNGGIDKDLLGKFLNPQLEEEEKRKREWLAQELQKVLTSGVLEQLQKFKKKYFDLLFWDQQQRLDNRVEELEEQGLEQEKLQKQKEDKILVEEQQEKEYLKQQAENILRIFKSERSDSGHKTLGLLSNWTTVRSPNRTTNSRTMIRLCPALLYETNQSRETLLHKAAKEKNFRMLQLFLEFEPDLNKQDCYGRTILHLVCSISNIVSAGSDAQMIISLIQHGANPDIEDAYGETIAMILQKRFGNGWERRLGLEMVLGKR